MIFHFPSFELLPAFEAKAGSHATFSLMRVPILPYHPHRTKVTAERPEFALAHKMTFNEALLTFTFFPAVWTDYFGMCKSLMAFKMLPR
mmetsp:Transcript_26786/g.64959  ORF Transcript_26786/g.64959 Transcript_26786/m.64959 type:complete len:89 (-) Transcript_26786:1879-2145(-)